MSARQILTPEQKVWILWEHLIEKVPVSQVCGKHGVSVVNFYNWQKQFFENEATAFERSRTRPMSNGSRMPTSPGSRCWK